MEREKLGMCVFSEQLIGIYAYNIYIYVCVYVYVYVTK